MINLSGSMQYEIGKLEWRCTMDLLRLGGNFGRNFHGNSADIWRKFGGKLGGKRKIRRKFPPEFPLELFWRKFGLEFFEISTKGFPEPL